jgi:carboxypeptidase C (cathepsin A)
MLALSARLSMQAPAQQTGASIPYGQSFVTKHTGVFGGQRVSYTATVGPMILTDSTGAPTVNFVSTSYVRDDVPDPRTRPVIFAFAGGPSTSSTAYHMRLLGPKRIMDPEQGREREGAQLVDNPEGLLDIADIVLVDPAETGFSRILPAGQRSYFYSVNGDVASIEQFITQWLKARGRESSPRYVMGGSYGSVRVVRIAWDFLRAGRPVDGIIMTANATMKQETIGPLGIATSLPTLTMIALYHGKVDRAGRTDSEIVNEAYRFAMNEYLGALLTVYDLTPAERAAWAAKLQARTGISAEYFLANDLAISSQGFMKELLKDKGLVLSNIYDGRETAPVSGTTASATQQDRGPNLFHVYMRDTLTVTYPLNEYADSAPNTNGWDFSGPPGVPAVRTAIGGNDWPKMLAEVMAKDPNVRVYSANGFHDLQATLGQARYLFSRTNLPRDRIVVREADGPHGLYTHPPTGAKIAQDLRQMLTAARQRYGK